MIDILLTVQKILIEILMEIILIILVSISTIGKAKNNGEVILNYGIIKT